MGTFSRCRFSLQIFVCFLFSSLLIAVLILPLSEKGLYRYRGRGNRDFSLHGVGFGNQELNVKKVEVEIKSLKSLLQFMREKVYPLHAAATHGRIDSIKKLLSIGEFLMIEDLFLFTMQPIMDASMLSRRYCMAILQSINPMIGEYLLFILLFIADILISLKCY